MKRWLAVRYWLARERRARQHLDELQRFQASLPAQLAATEREIITCATQRVVADLALPPLRGTPGSYTRSREVRGV